MNDPHARVPTWQWVFLLACSLAACFVLAFTPFGWTRHLPLPIVVVLIVCCACATVLSLEMLLQTARRVPRSDQAGMGIGVGLALGVAFIVAATLAAILLSRTPIAVELVAGGCLVIAAIYTIVVVRGAGTRTATKPAPADGASTATQEGRP